MRLTKQTGHATRILIECALAADGDLVKVADLSERLGIAKQNTFKIVHLLSRAGFLSSVRGPSGGIKLSRPAHDIRVGDVVKAMEDTSVEIAGQRDDKERLARPVSSLFDEALAAFISVLDAHTIADLARTNKTQPARTLATTVSQKKRAGMRKS